MVKLFRVQTEGGYIEVDLEKIESGSGDMLKSAYDPDEDGVIVKTQLDTALANTSGTNTGDQTLVGLGGIAHSLATAINDFLVASGAGAFVKKTLAETKTILDWAADIATHAALTTGIHGVGIGTVAKVADIATDTNLSANAQNAVSIRHAQNTDTDLEATFEAALKNTDNHTSGTTNKVYTATEQTKLAGVETGAEVNNISDANATDLTDGGPTTLHSHAGGSEAFPIGAVFISVVSTNPNTLLGYGTWSAFGAGKVLVGLDSGDTDFDVAEETGGAKTHTHAGHDNHVVTQPSAHAAGLTDTDTGTRKGGTSGAATLTDSHDHATPALTHTGSAVDAHSAHDSPSHLPPFIVVYMWKRTA